jgi:hypothetical protein
VAAVVVGVVAGGVGFVAMRRGSAFADTEGAEILWQLATVAVGAAIGAIAGGYHGIVAGTAVLVAVLDVYYGWMLAWGLVGGDGDPDTPLAKACGIVLLVSVLVVAWVAARRGADAGPIALGVMLIPALAWAVGMVATRGAGRLRQGALYGLPLVVPPALLTVAS